jgi:hypothetical protein
MPQTYYFSDGGELDFNFDYTRFNVNILLSANFSLNTVLLVGHKRLEM